MNNRRRLKRVFFSSLALILLTILLPIYTVANIIWSAVKSIRVGCDHFWYNVKYILSQAWEGYVDNAKDVFVGTLKDISAPPKQGKP